MALDVGGNINSFVAFVHSGFAQDSEGLECHLKPGQAGQIGAYSNTPGDAGGATRFGVTLETAQEALADSNVQALFSGLDDEGAAWIAATAGRELTPDDMKTFPQSVASCIYYVRFWNDPHFDRLPGGLLTELVFDCGMGLGTKEATIVLQRTLLTFNCYHGNIDGEIAPAPYASDTVIGATQAEATVRDKILSTEFVRQRDIAIDKIIAANPGDAKFAQGWFWRDHAFDDKIATDDA